MANKKNNNKITVRAKKFPKIYLDAGIADGGNCFRQKPSLRTAVLISEIAVITNGGI